MLPQCAGALVATSLMIGSALATVSIPVRPDGKEQGPRLEQMDESAKVIEAQRRAAVEQALRSRDMIEFYDNATPAEIAQYVDLDEATFQPAATSNPVQIYVNVKQRTMTVRGPGGERYDWRVATGRVGHDTQTGTNRPIVARDEMINHKSSLYKDGAMPYAMHYDGPYAIHGTYKPGSIGKRASHGCIRLSMQNIKTLFYLVKQYGGGNVTVR